MNKVLVSACLLGHELRYDASGAADVEDLIAAWRTEGRLITVCPEMAGGLGVPRPPAEIVGGDGHDVLAGAAQVMTRDRSVTAEFVRGANVALQLAQRHGIKVAVLKARSPSCGAGEIYDGSFSGSKQPGDGVTAALLIAHGVAVFSEEQLEQADAHLRSLDVA